MDRESLLEPSPKTLGSSLNVRVAREVLGLEVEPVTILEGYQYQSGSEDCCGAPILVTVPVIRRHGVTAFISWEHGDRGAELELVPDYCHNLDLAYDEVVCHLTENGWTVRLEIGRPDRGDGRCLCVVSREVEGVTESVQALAWFPGVAICRAALLWQQLVYQHAASTTAAEPNERSGPGGPEE